MSKRWSDLSPRTRQMIVLGAAVESGLKIAVLVDLRRRTPEQVRGSKRAWASAMVLNSFGLLPAAYFALGRRSQDS